MDIPAHLREYQQAQGALSIMDWLLLFENRIVVPDLCRDEILSKLHENYQGHSKCKEKQIVVHGGLD